MAGVEDFSTLIMQLLEFVLCVLVFKTLERAHIDTEVGELLRSST